MILDTLGGSFLADGPLECLFYACMLGDLIPPLRDLNSARDPTAFRVQLITMRPLSLDKQRIDDKRRAAIAIRPEPIGRCGLRYEDQ